MGKRIGRRTKEAFDILKDVNLPGYDVSKAYTVTRWCSFQEGKEIEFIPNLSKRHERSYPYTKAKISALIKGVRFLGSPVVLFVLDADGEIHYKTQREVCHCLGPDDE